MCLIHLRCIGIPILGSIIYILAFPSVFSIVNEEPNAEECKARIKQYEEAHRIEIVIRQSHRADEERAIQDQIASEQREAERRKRDYQEGEKAIALAKRKFKQESTEVLLGEREEVSADLVAAQMQGYRNELKRQREGKATATAFVSPRVREPEGGLLKRESKLDREIYRKRQAAGGGIPAGSLTSQERNWNETLSTLLLSSLEQGMGRRGGGSIPMDTQ